MKLIFRTPLMMAGLGAIILTGNIFVTGDSSFLNKNSLMPAPAGDEPTIVRKENEEDEQSLQWKRKRWYEAIHQAAPGTDWRAIETQNMLRLNDEITARQQSNQKMPAESFANGALQGTWNERGSLNQSGRVIPCDYYKSSNKLFLISDAGMLYRGVPDSANWKALNNNLVFGNRTIRVLPNISNGVRILAAIGLNVYYSDNDGALFTPSTGITFPVGWGGNYVSQIVSLNDANKSVYVLTRLWDPTPWNARYWLYRSTDRGQTFSLINKFNEGDDDRLSLWVPYNSSTTLYALGNQDAGLVSTLYSISGINVSALNTSTDLPVNVSCKFRGCKTTGITMYALINNNKLYRSVNLGINWTLQSTLPENGSALGVSITNPDQVSYGGVNCFRSSNGGSSWTQVNSWVDYYGNVVAKLHADIQRIEYFKRSNGTEFGLNTNDGGIYRTDDFLVNNTNIGMKGLNISQYYDVKSEASSTWVYCGSQDQGFQRSGSASGTGKINLSQVISGDYGFLQLTGTNNNHLWTQYPGGEIYYYNNSHQGLSSTYSLPGSNKPLYGWILPTARAYPSSNNKIFITGGDITGGSGSYLVKLTAQTTSPYSITATQFNYNFRANSNGTAGLCAVETTPLNSNKIYVATEDGSFFYSSNSGTSWTKNTNFTGPDHHWLHGNAIYASRLTANLVYFGGSGYSNPAIYKSTNGGAIFSPMNNGLPDCTIFDLDASTNETLVFAATSAGPYVYLVSADQWYSMKGTAAICEYYSVEYLGAVNKVRFGTYGRGYWDFNILVQPTAMSAENNIPDNNGDEQGFVRSLFPNPATANVDIQMKSINNNVSIRIFDVEGKMKKELITSNVIKINVDISNFANGLYFVNISNGERSQTLKLLKQ